MIFRLEIVQFIVKARLGGGFAQFWELRLGLEHINCIVQQTWEVGTVHCAVPRGKVINRGLRLRSV